MKENGNLFARITISLVLLVLLLSTGQDASASLPQKPQKRILLLYGVDRMHPAHEMTEQGIRSVAASDPTYDIELYSEYMDSSRFQGLEYKETLARFLNDKYSAEKPDLVITVYPSALSFVLNYCEHTFPGIPVVACTIFESTARELEQTAERARTTGVIFKGDIGDIVPMARALRPGMRRIALVGGASDLDKITLKVIRNAMKQYEPEMEVLDITGLAMSRIIERVGSLPSDSIILYSSIFTDGQGRHFMSRQALGMILRATNVPVFSPFDSYLGYGIVGGNLLSFEAQGRKAAELAMRILAGESPGDIPFSDYDTTVTMFDGRELKRWGISEASLPDGSIVKYREFSVWDEHRGQIIGAAAFFFLETLLIVALVMNLQKTRQTRKDLRTLTHRLIWVQEEERRRLARELHDDLTQRLAVLAIQAGRMEQTARDGSQPVLEEFHDLRDQAIQISADIHNISRRIHPSILDDLGLEKAIMSECTRFSSREGIIVDFTAEGLPDTLPKDVALSLYRIIQEGLTNIAKYACAGHATISLKGTIHGIDLSLQDDGIGFDAAEVRKKPGLGLSSMRERVRIIRGKIRITSEAEKGTTILVNVPMKLENGT